MARLSDGSGAARFALKTLQSSALCGAVISALNSLVKEEYLYLNVLQKSTGNISACTLALYHNRFVLSREYKHMFVLFHNIIYYANIFCFE